MEQHVTSKRVLHSMNYLPRYSSKSAGRRSTLYPGSRLLLMVHVRLSSTAVPLRHRILRGHARQNSDDLIEDLEHHLGSASTEYLQVCITYHYSAFPCQARSPGPATGGTDNDKIVDGIASLQTSMGNGGSSGHQTSQSVFALVTASHATARSAAVRDHGVPLGPCSRP